MYIKGDYTAVENGDTRYFRLFYNGKPIFGDQGTLFSLRFILDMGFEEIK